MTKPKKGKGGRTTPKKTAPARPSSPGFMPGFASNQRGADDGGDGFGLELLEAILDEQGLALAGSEEAGPESEDFEGDALAIVLDRIDESYTDGPASFIEEISHFAWTVYILEQDGEGMLEVAIGSGEAGSPAAAALSTLAVTEEHRRAAGDRLAMSSGEFPRWLLDLGTASVSRIASSSSLNDDDFELLFEVALSGVDSICIATRIDRLREELIVDSAVIGESFDELIKPEDAEDFPEVEMLSLQEASDRLSHSYELSLSVGRTLAQNEAAGIPIADKPLIGLAIAGWLTRMLPASTTEPFMGLPDERLDLLHRELEDFRGGELSAAERDVIDGIVLFTGESDPYRWSPGRLMEMVARSSFDRLDLLPPLLREYLDFAGDRNQRTLDLREQNMTVVDAIEKNIPALQEAMDS